MDKKKLISLALGILVAFGLVYFIRNSSEEPEDTHLASSEQAHDHDHEPREPAAPQMRANQLLDDPAYQQPAEDPLVTVVAQNKILSGPVRFLGSRISADGKHLISTGDSYEGLWVANADGSGLKQISDGQMAGWRPVTTTHGELIFRTAEFDEEGNLTFTMHLYDFETGETEIIYQGVNEDLYPAWLSKDEDYLVMRLNNELVSHPLREIDGATPLFERDEGIAYADGGQVWYQHFSAKEPLVLSTDTQATGGEVASPTGTHVAYLSGNKNSALIVDLNTGNEVDIGEGSNLAWSPDGKLLLYDVTSDDGHDIFDSQLFIVDADGNHRHRVTFEPGHSFYNPSWSPDGSYFVAVDLHTGEVHRFDLETAVEHTQ